MAAVQNPGFSDTIVLSDAYFADVFFDEHTRRMISVTTPLAITYEVKPSHKKPPKHLTQAMQRTGIRRVTTFPMIKALPLRLALAPGSRR